jgi:hypothetical protein
MEANQNSTEVSLENYRPTPEDWLQLQEVLMPIALRIDQLSKTGKDGFEQIDELQSFVHDYDDAGAKLKMYMRQLVTDRLNSKRS